MMKLVLAPNALKGSLSASQTALAMAAGALKVKPDLEIVRRPVADGGDGMVEIMAEALGGEIRSLRVAGPRGDVVNADFCLFPGRPPLRVKTAAAIEMALASGLALLPEARRDPTQTTSLGTGQIIAETLRLGARHIIIGVGGSATVDGGIGMASALGIRFLDVDGKVLEPVGNSLGRIFKIEMDSIHPAVEEAVFEVACDVDNPLLGAKGAARVYAPQKGATPRQVEMLADGLENLALCIERDLGIEIQNIPGGGAAGGLAAGLHAFLSARLLKGVDLVLDTIDLENALLGADLVLTAEGSLDAQTAFGKAPVGVAHAARRAGIPCIAIAGRVSMKPEALHHHGFTAAYPLSPIPITVEESMHKAKELITATTERVIREFMANKL